MNTKDPMQDDGLVITGRQARPGMHAMVPDMPHLSITRAKCKVGKCLSLCLRGLTLLWSSAASVEALDPSMTCCLGYLIPCAVQHIHT